MKGEATDGKITREDGLSGQALVAMVFLSTVTGISCVACSALTISLLCLPHCNAKLYLLSPPIRVLLEKSSSRCPSSLPRGPGETLMPANWWTMEMPTTTWTMQTAWRKSLAR